MGDARRPAAALAKIDRLRAYKQAFRTYRSFFLDPAIHTASASTASARYSAGILGSASPTNVQLLEALGGSTRTNSQALASVARSSPSTLRSPVVV